MGARGPKPKKPALKILAGNPGHRPIPYGRAVTRVKRGVPVRPVELTGEAGEEWDCIAGALDSAGMLAEVDRGILAAYCLAVADMLAARDAINREGRIVSEIIQNSRGEVLGKRHREHPACKMLDRASARVHKLGSALGLNADSRSRLEVDAGPAEGSAGNKVISIRDRIQAARNGG